MGYSIVCVKRTRKRSKTINKEDSSGNRRQKISENIIGRIQQILFERKRINYSLGERSKSRDSIRVAENFPTTQKTVHPQNTSVRESKHSCKRRLTNCGLCQERRLFQHLESNRQLSISTLQEFSDTANLFYGDEQPFFYSSKRWIILYLFLHYHLAYSSSHHSSLPLSFKPIWVFCLIIYLS